MVALACVVQPGVVHEPLSPGHFWTCYVFKRSKQVQRVVNHWLLQRGFSVGICDALAPRGTMDRISTIISEAKGRVDQVLESAQVQHIVPVSSSVCLCWYFFFLYIGFIP